MGKMSRGRRKALDAAIITRGSQKKIQNERAIHSSEVFLL
jgi:hypothetical protein